MDMHAVRSALPETIATARLVLRRPVFADVPALTALANNSKISAMLSDLPHPYTSEDAIAFIETRARSDNAHAFAVSLADGPLIGIASLMDKGTDLPQIGYWLGEEHWGHGYASEAAGALIEAVFATGQVPVLSAWAMATNPGSHRVLEKLGFTLVDERVDNCGQHKGVPVRIYTLEGAAQRAAQ